MVHPRCCTIVVALLVSIGTVHAGEKTKHSQKRSLADLVQNLRSKKSVLRQSAIKALSEPFDSLPIEQWFLLNLEEDGSEFLEKAKPLLPQLIGMLRHRDEEVVQTALMLITRMGTEARTAAPALSRFATNAKQSHSIRWRAAESMFFVTPETTPVLCRLMPRPDSASPIFVRYRPGNKRHNDMQTNRPLMYMDLGMHADLIMRLLVHSGHTQVEVPCLMKAATGEYSLETRLIAAMVLLLLVSEDRVKIPGLKSLLSDEDPYIRELGAVAILRTRSWSRLSPKMIRKLRLKKAKLKEIEEFVRKSREEEKKAYDNLVAYVKDHPANGIPDMVFEIRFNRGPSRREAIRILRDAGPVAKSAVPSLLKMLTHRDVDTRRLAADALQKIDPAALKGVKNRSHERPRCHRTRNRRERRRR